MILDYYVNAKVYSDCVVLYKSYANGSGNTGWNCDCGQYCIDKVLLKCPNCGLKKPEFERVIHGFGPGAQGRLKKRLDNFTNIFVAANKTKLLNYTYKGVTHKRKPVFITLTIPKQPKPYSESDYWIKQKGLVVYLENLKKTYGTKQYIWKAEAQERGEIHFHLLTDCFIHHKTARRLWFKFLQRNDLLNPGQTLKNSSRIVWIKQITNIASMKYYLMGYFSQRRTDEGKLISKHDKTKIVRDICGNSWGSSDTLIYDPLSFENVEPGFLEDLKDNALEIIEDKKEDRWAVVVLKRSEKIVKEVQNGLFTQKVTRYKTINRFPGPLQDMLTDLHLERANCIYS